jgi:hypothetical protein
MTDDVDDIVVDLKRLSRRQGLQAPDLADHMGPGLAAVLELELDRPSADIRQQAQAVIVEAGRVLEPDIRLAVLVTLGADGWATGSLLQDRIGAVAEHMQRDARTVRRRIDMAFAELAEALVARRNVPASADLHAPPGWYVETMHAHLQLGSPRSTLTEDREIVSQTNGLSELTIGLSAPQLSEGPIDIDITAEHGATVAGARRMSSSYWTFLLRLPRTLRTGERHRYVVTFSCPPMHAMQPYYVLSPLRHVKRFTAEVDFGSPENVDLVWRVDGAAPSVLRDGEPTDQVCDVGPDGVVHESFSEITQGLSYGVAWRLPTH